MAHLASCATGKHLTNGTSNVQYATGKFCPEGYKTGHVTSGACVTGVPLVREVPVAHVAQVRHWYFYALCAHMHTPPVDRLFSFEMDERK